MKIYLLFFLTSFSLLSYGQPSLSAVRESYRTAVDSEKNAESFFANLKSVEKTNGTVLVAYKGAAYMLLARYEPLFKKKAKLKDGKEWIETYIKNNPNSVEGRFIRLSIQENLPKIVGYRQNIKEDKEFIDKKISTVKDSQLKKMLETIK